MQSQINFVDSQTFQPNPEVEAGRIVLSSQDLNVAHRFNFTDQSHFPRVFKQVKGLTPKQFLPQA